MVHWTEAERSSITSVWGKLPRDDVGHCALTRLLIVYPWTQRYFASFGNLSNPAAILGNPKVALHGKVVMNALDKGVKHLDNINATYNDLSVMHSDKLHVDPDNFKHLGDCICVCAAAKMGSAFTIEYHAAFRKFLREVAAALSRRYH